jgi:hypothetical protein
MKLQIFFDHQRLLAELKKKKYAAFLKNLLAEKAFGAMGDIEKLKKELFEDCLSQSKNENKKLEDLERDKKIIHFIILI